MSSKNKKSTLFLVLFFIVTGGIFLFYYYKTTRPNNENYQSKLGFWGEEDHKIRDFKFANQDGDSITLANVNGKVLVVEYFFTTCKSICPVMNENMSNVYARFKNDDDVVILSHSVDPKRDTVGAMKAYAQGFGADSKHWMFLTGDKKDLYNQAYYSYLITAADSSKTDISADFIHTNNFVLVDKQGRLRARKDKEGKVVLYDGTNKASVDEMMEDITTLQKEQ